MYKYLLCFRYVTTKYIALCSIVSVMLGVATLIVVNGVMDGFHHKMRARIHGILSDMSLESMSTNGFRDPKRVMEIINELVGDKVEAMTPAIEIFGILTYKNQMQGQEYTRPVKIMGIDPIGRGLVGDFSQHLESQENKNNPSFAVRGPALAWRREHAKQLQREADEGVIATESAVIGYQIASFRNPDIQADQFLISPGHEVILTTIAASRKPQPIFKRFVVSDLYKSEMSEYDQNYVFVPLEELQEMRLMGDAATMIQIKLKNYADAEYVRSKLQSRFSLIDFGVYTWEDKQQAILQAIKVETALLNIVLFFIIAVAGFGILAIFSMIVVEKTHDIGILKAHGASDSGVMGIFLQYGLALGLLGCGIGSAFGVAFATNINAINHMLESWLGFSLFPQDIYYFKEIPIQIDPLKILLVNSVATLIAVMASILPARRAAALKPVEALRHD